MKTIAGFANAYSGDFYIGVKDSNIQNQMIEKCREYDLSGRDKISDSVSLRYFDYLVYGFYLMNMQNAYMINREFICCFKNI